MTYESKLSTLLAKYRGGVYTAIELYPLLVRITPETDSCHLLEDIPADLAAGFRQWIKDYPLEDGVAIAGGYFEELPRSTLIKLKSMVG